jgi:hypothetical protein
MVQHYIHFCNPTIWCTANTFQSNYSKHIYNNDKLGLTAVVTMAPCHRILLVNVISRHAHHCTPWTRVYFLISRPCTAASCSLFNNRILLIQVLVVFNGVTWLNMEPNSRMACSSDPDNHLAATVATPLILSNSTLHLTVTQYGHDIF